MTPPLEQALEALLEAGDAQRWWLARRRREAKAAQRRYHKVVRRFGKRIPKTGNKAVQRRV